ncbi:MAG: putative metal-dependent hydrolase [Thermoanaerobaculia bacterium]
MTEDLRYPVGRLQEEGPLSEARRLELIEQIAETPERLRAAVHGLNPAQLDTPYRPGGWTVRQVLHHVPDSHLNAYVRFKLALTEDSPPIKPYAEALWAALPDTGRTAPEVSLTLLDALHKRWVILLRAMDTAGWARTLQHPERGTLTLDQMLVTYAWHGRHHVAHITALREREGWGEG